MKTVLIFYFVDKADKRHVRQLSMLFALDANFLDKCFLKAPRNDLTITITILAYRY